MAEKARPLSKKGNVSFAKTSRESAVSKDKASLLSSAFSKATLKASEQAGKLKKSTQRWMSDVGAGVIAFRAEYAARVAQRDFNDRVLWFEEQGFSVVKSEDIKSIRDTLESRSDKKSTSNKTITDMKTHLDSAFDIGVRDVKSSILPDSKLGEEIEKDAELVETSTKSSFKQSINKAKSFIKNPFASVYGYFAAKRLSKDAVVDVVSQDVVIDESVSDNVAKDDNDVVDKKSVVSDIKDGCTKASKESVNAQFEALLGMLKLQAELPPADRDFKSITEAMVLSAKMMREEMELDSDESKDKVVSEQDDKTKSKKSKSVKKSTKTSKSSQAQRIAKAEELALDIEDADDAFAKDGLPFA